MGTTAEKLTYLNETKTKLYAALQKAGLVSFDSTTTYRDLAERINLEYADLYANFIEDNYKEVATTKTFSDFFTHSRGTLATMTDGYGAELVTNGTFDTGISGWSSPTATLSWDYDGYLSISHASVASGAYQTFTTSAGKLYAVTATLISRTGSNTLGPLVRAGNGSTPDAGIIDSEVLSAGETKTIYFVATGTTSYVYLRASNDFTTEWDNISVREAPVVKWAPHNLLPAPNNFSSINPDATVTSGFSDPDGGNNAFRFVFTGAQADVAHSAPVIDGVLYTLAFKIKPDPSVSWIRVNIAGYANWFEWDNNWASGTTGAGFVSLSYEELGGGWYSVEAKATAGATGSYGFGAYHSAGNNNLSEVASTFYMYEMHAYRSDLGGMVDNPDRGDSYVPTTSSAAYLPRRNHHVYNGYEWVNEGLLHEATSITNYVEDSDGYAFWATTNVNIARDQGLGPDGNVSLTRITETTATGAHGAYRGSSTNSVIGDTYTASFFVKKGTGASAPDWVQITFGTNTHGSVPYANFNISTGVIGNVAGGTANIENYGNGIYRCSFTSEATVNAQVLQPIIAFTNNTDVSSRVPSYTGVATADAFYGFVQIENSSFPTSYIPTSGATTTRAYDSITVPPANFPWPETRYIGRELVTNGDFDRDLSGWTVNGAVWESERIKVTDSNSSYNRRAYQYLSGLTVGKIYALTATVDKGTMTQYASVQIRNQSNDDFIIGTPDFSSGTFTVYFTYTTPVYVNILVDTTTSSSKYAYFDNVTVREISPRSLSMQVEGRTSYAGGGVTYLVFWQKSTSENIQWYIDHTSLDTAPLKVQQKFLNVSSVVTSSNVYPKGLVVPFSVSARHGENFVNNSVDGLISSANTAPKALPDLRNTTLTLFSDVVGTIGSFRILVEDIGDTGIEEASSLSTEPSLSLVFDGTETSYVDLGWRQ